VHELVEIPEAAGPEEKLPQDHGLGMVTDRDLQTLPENPICAPAWRNERLKMWTGHYRRLIHEWNSFLLMKSWMHGRVFDHFPLSAGLSGRIFSTPEKLENDPERAFT